MHAGSITMLSRRLQTLVVVVFAFVTALLGACVATALHVTLEQGSFGLGFYFWPGPVLGPYTVTGWGIGGLVTAVTTTLLLTGPRATARRVRVLASCVALTSLAILGLRVVQPIPYGKLDVVTLVIAVLAALLVIARSPRFAPCSRRLRAWMAGVTAGSVIAIATPMLVSRIEDYWPQTLPDFTIELASAYPIGHGAIVVEPNGQPGEIVEYRGERYTIHHDDALHITSDHVARVRWRDGGIVFRFDREIARELARRSRWRMSMQDALFVDNKLVMIPLYQSILSDTMFLIDVPADSTTQLRSLYDQLTR